MHPAYSNYKGTLVVGSSIAIWGTHVQASCPRFDVIELAGVADKGPTRKFFEREEVSPT